MSSQPCAPSGVGMLYGSGKRRTEVLSSVNVMTVSSWLSNRCGLRSCWASCHDAAAVDEQHLTGNEGTRRGQQKSHRPHDVVWIADASEWGRGRVVTVWVADCPGAFGIGESWCDRVDSNLVGASLASQCPGQADDRRLASNVVREVRRAAVGDFAGQVHHAATTGGGEDRQCGTVDEPRSTHVHGHDLVELVDPDVFRGFAGHRDDGGTIDDTVESAELFSGACHGLRNLYLVGHVAGSGTHGGLAEGLFKASSVDVDREHQCSGVDEVTHDGAADAARGTSNEYPRSIEVFGRHHD